MGTLAPCARTFDLSALWTKALAKGANNGHNEDGVGEDKGVGGVVLGCNGEC